MNVTHDSTETLAEEGRGFRLFGSDFHARVRGELWGVGRSWSEVCGVAEGFEGVSRGLRGSGVDLKMLEEYRVDKKESEVA
jgi:hypothetical protein